MQGDVMDGRGRSSTGPPLRSHKCPTADCSDRHTAPNMLETIEFHTVSGWIVLHVNNSSKKELNDRTLSLVTLGSECCYPDVDPWAWRTTFSPQTGLLSLSPDFCQHLLALSANPKINSISPVCKKIDSSQGQGEKTKLFVSKTPSAT